MTYRSREVWLRQCESALEEAIANGWNYVRIPLTQGQHTLVDLEDYEQVRDSGPWCAYKTSVGFYGYRQVGNKQELLHRFLLDAPKGLDVDHTDNDTLNNRRSNLRLATRSENMANRRGPQSNNHSGYLGVDWHRREGKWRARIMVRGKPIHLGYFDDPIEAARVRDAAAIQHHGSFATLNFA